MFAPSRDAVCGFVSRLMVPRPANAIDTLQRAALLCHAGGFARDGEGDAEPETVARNLLVGLASDVPRREIAAWGATPSTSTRLAEIASSGASIVSTAWRFGARWKLPERMLQRRAAQAVAAADLVVFTKTFDARTHHELRALAAAGRKAPMVLVAPARPREMWGKAAPDGLLAAFDTIIVQADRFEDDLRRMGYEGRVETIPHMPDPWRTPAIAPVARPGGDEALRVGVFGPLESRKNVAGVLDALALLTRWREGGAIARRYELHIHGDGAELAALRSRVSASADLAGRIVFHGRADGRELVDAIDACHVVVSASRVEGQAPLVLEALRRGRPAVTTAAGALPEVLNDAELGALVPHNDADAMARAIVTVTDALLAGSLSPMRIHETWERRFGARAVREKYLDLLYLLLARSRAAASPAREGVAARKVSMVIKPLVPRKPVRVSKAGASPATAVKAPAPRKATTNAAPTLAARFAAKKRLPPAFAVAPEKLARAAAQANSAAPPAKKPLPAMTPEAFRKAAPAALRAMLGGR